jgi:GH24 family phage-related lysozyme (muramidase)
MKAFDGTLFNRAEAEKFINSISTDQLKWIKFLVVHNTGAPNMTQEDKTPDRNKDGTGEDDRMRNTAPHYAKWGGRGPSFFVFNSGKIGLGTVLPAKGVHSPSWNNTSIGIEMVADFRKGVDNPYTEPGLTIVDTTAWLFAAVLKKLGLSATNETIKLHKEDKKTTHDCPGDLFKKDDFLKRVQAYLKGTTPTVDSTPAPKAEVPTVVIPPKPEGPQKVMQPKQFMYSDYCVAMMKKVEGLRLKAYYDKPGWAIGYGHNSTGRIAPIPHEGMTLKNEQEAHDILLNDMNDKVRYLNAWVKVPLAQSHVDALVIFIFQQGPGNFKSKLLPLVNEKKHWSVAKYLETYPHPHPGVQRRRKMEAEIYRGNRPTKW